VQGKREIKDLSVIDLRSLSPFVDRSVMNQLRKVIALNPGETNVDLKMLIPKRNSLVDIRKVTSKTLREIVEEKEPICIYKFGAILTPIESVNWGEALRRVTSVRHKSLLLRIAHGEIYTKEKLYRYGLADSPKCSRCDQVEDLEHKLIKCEYVARIWRLVLSLTDGLYPVTQFQPQPSIENKILGVNGTCDPLALTIHAEIIQRIIALKDGATYLLSPKHFTLLAIRNIERSERLDSVKEKCNDLLEKLAPTIP
jgi:hypothetical protein